MDDGAAKKAAEQAVAETINSAGEPATGKTSKIRKGDSGEGTAAAEGKAREDRASKADEGKDHKGKERKNKSPKDKPRKDDTNSDNASEEETTTNEEVAADGEDAGNRRWKRGDYVRRKQGSPPARRSGLALGRRVRGPSVCPLAASGSRERAAPELGLCVVTQKGGRTLGEARPLFIRL